MCFYPRGIKKEWIDEFRPELAPDRELFKEWKEFEKQVGHEEAFHKTRYEERFQLSPITLAHLEVLNESAAKKDIYLERLSDF